MQIGCDPKADSTLSLRQGAKVPTILDLIRKKGKAATLEEMVVLGYNKVICLEAGGPTPGVGCAGRGIIIAFEALAERNAFGIYKPDVVFYDVLGDVVCGGFAMPLRGGYADYVFVLTSGENMSIYAAANIVTAVSSFHDRGYAKLGGVILNRRGVENEDAKVNEFVKEIGSVLVGTLDRSPLVQKADDMGKTVAEAFPESEMTVQYEKLADAILQRCQEQE